MRRIVPAVLISVCGWTATGLNAQIEDVVSDGVYGEASPRTMTPPVYPPDALKAGAEGIVRFDFIVTAEGAVADLKLRESKDPAKAVDPRLGAAVLAVVKDWTFSPALNDSKPEPTALRGEVRFLLKGRGGKPSVNMPMGFEQQPSRTARVKYQPDPSYPEELLPRKLPGTAEFQFQVSAAGEVEDITVMHASDASFVAPGLATLKRWKFEPATQGPLKVISRKRSPMEFSVEGANTDVPALLAANGISGLGANTYDVPPVPRSLPAPVYPRDRLVAGEAGAAEAEFTINDKGFTESVLVTLADQPEFGAALAAAVELWVFKPALRDRERTRMNLRVRYQFAALDGSADARLAGLLKTGIEGAKGLDQRITPLWRIAPAYPQALLAEKPTGSATIEFIIDREGRCRCLRVVSSTHDAFGWAAATAISQWVFVPPTKQGQPVDVRVSIPVEFSPPQT